MEPESIGTNILYGYNSTATQSFLRSKEFYCILFCGKVKDKGGKYTFISSQISYHDNCPLLPSASIMEVIFVSEFKGLKKLTHGPHVASRPAVGPPSYRHDTVKWGLITLRSNVHLEILTLVCWMNNWSRSKMG
jgi:hypothetical protein